MSQDPMTEINKQLEGMKTDLKNLRAETVGDRNQIETFKATLRGRIERLEESAEKLVSLKQHEELKEAVEGLSTTVEKATGVLNKAVSTVLFSALAGLGIWLLNRLIGS